MIEETFSRFRSAGNDEGAFKLPTSSEVQLFPQSDPKSIRGMAFPEPVSAVVLLERMKGRWGSPSTYTNEYQESYPGENDRVRRCTSEAESGINFLLRWTNEFKVLTPEQQIDVALLFSELTKPIDQEIKQSGRPSSSIAVALMPLANLLKNP